MAKELILLSKRQFDAMSKGLEKNTEVDNNEQKESEIYHEKNREHKIQICDTGTQIGNGLIFSGKDSDQKRGPPGTPAKKKKGPTGASAKKKKTKIKWLKY